MNQQQEKKLKIGSVALKGTGIARNNRQHLTN